MNPAAPGEMKPGAPGPESRTRVPSPANTLEAIRHRGTLLCGLDQSEAEYSLTDQHGPRVAFDTDLCRAVAAAILGPQAHYAIKGYPDNDTALHALQAGEVDLIPTVDPHAQASNNALFTQPVLNDAVGLLVPAASHLTTLARLSGRRICFLAETNVEDSLRAYFAAHHLELASFPFSEQGEMEAAFATHNCDALAGDLTRLAVVRISLSSHPGDYTILPETAAPDPLAMASRANDEPMHRVLVAVLSALLQRAPPLAQSAVDETLPPGWQQNVLAAGGDFNQIFTRDLGADSPLHLPNTLSATH
jgi:general L-amino acid transport system substrate-binding protein